MTPQRPTGVVLLATATGALEMDDDADALVSALAARGVASQHAVWDDPSVDWADAAAVVVRSTWDYARRLGEFLEWAAAVDAVTDLHNPLAVLRWNTDKRYLEELTASGLDVVPTTFLDPGTPEAGVGAAMAELAATGAHWVVKPSVSAGSKDTGRFGPESVADAVALAGEIAASGRTTMLQPYQSDVDTAGETGLVYFWGELSHAFTKSAMLPEAGPSQIDNSPSSLFVEERIRPHSATPAEVALGDAVVAELGRRWGGPLLYARVDLVPGPGGDPRLLELELTEPSWFLAADPTAADRAADAVAALVGTTG